MDKDVLKVTSSQITCIEGEGATTELLARAMNKVILGSFSYQDRRACLLVTGLSRLEILGILYRFGSTFSTLTILKYLDSMYIYGADKGLDIIGLLFNYGSMADIFVDGIDKYILPESEIIIFESCIKRGINLTYTKGGV